MPLFINEVDDFIVIKVMYTGIDELSGVMGSDALFRVRWDQMLYSE